jgi:hypothetical protein
MCGIGFRARGHNQHDRRNVWLADQIRRVHADNYGVCGLGKVWLALNREGVAVARCTAERLMHQLGRVPPSGTGIRASSTCRERQYLISVNGKLLKSPYMGHMGGRDRWRSKISGGHGGTQWHWSW